MRVLARREIGLLCVNCVGVMVGGSRAYTESEFAGAALGVPLLGAGQHVHARDLSWSYTDATSEACRRAMLCTAGTAAFWALHRPVADEEPFKLLALALPLPSHE